MDYMTLKEAAEKWGVTPRRINYYCAGGPYSRRCEDGYNLVDPERRGETCGYEDKTRKGIKT